MVGSMVTHPWGKRGLSAAPFLPGQSGSARGIQGEPGFLSPVPGPAQSSHSHVAAPNGAKLVHAFGNTGGAEDQVSWPGKAKRLVATSSGAGSDTREAVKDKVTQVQGCRVLAEVPELTPAPCQETLLPMPPVR